MRAVSAYVKYDSKASLAEARARLPLVRMMEQYGQAPPDGKTKSFRCSHCKKKGKAGIFVHDGVEFFKCQSTSCPTGARAMEAVGYIAFISGRHRSDAFTDCLKMAGVWKEQAKIQYQDMALPERPAEPAQGTEATQATAAEPVQSGGHLTWVSIRWVISMSPTTIRPIRILRARRKDIHDVGRCSP